MRPVRHTGAMRRGVWLLVLGALLAALGAASAYAAGTTATTTTTSTTTTTTATTTTAATTTTPAPTFSRLAPSYLPAGCVGAGDAVIAVPGRPVLALGTPAYSRGPSAYPTQAPIVRFLSSAVGGSSCRTAHVTLESASLFGGAVTAAGISATHGRGSVTGLKLYGSPVALSAGRSVNVGGWGQVTVDKRVGRITAPLVVQLVAAHRGLPAGTTIALAFGASPQTAAKQRHKHRSSGGTAQHSGTTTDENSLQKAPAHAKKQHRHRHKPVPQPLTATPSLGYKSRHYVFPVDGGASYVDTYGAGRSDIYDGWHHGDDLFAPLGTPVVAVANGKLSLVGWNQLGGWRLWLTDGDGNSFYYAHLAGYSRWVLSHPNVRAGQVVGFLGRTGDAFTTDPHLHFEIHPQTLLSLGYDGAVDPTTYLQKWRIVHVPAKEMPQPAKLKAPMGTPRQEATVVWRELLVARHLPLTGPVGSGAAGGSLPFPQPRAFEASGVGPGVALFRPTAAHISASSEDIAPWLGGGLGGAALVAALSTGAFFTIRRRRRTPEEAGAAGEIAS
jgi:murein DD-endopeptidase MepM/ murein hydrolase activator NlpD